MLVEDDPDDEALTLRALMHESIRSQVVIARDGAEALAHLLGDQAPESHAMRHLPALILLNLKLPKVSGQEVLCRLRADDRARSIPVIVLVTSQEEQTLIEQSGFPCTRAIRKPVDLAAFTEATRQLGLRWPELNADPPTKSV